MVEQSPNDIWVSLTEGKFQYELVASIRKKSENSVIVANEVHA